MQPRIAFVTGASAGIGESIARRYVAAGVKVVAADDRHELHGPRVRDSRPAAGDGGRGRGHVVNMGSIAATYPYPGGNVYGATKSFVHQFSLGLRADLHGTGVRVTCIEPGLIGGTEFSEVRFGGDAQRAAGVYSGTTPLGPDDIAAAVEWVTSQPEHVNVNVIELMPVSQSFAALPIDRPDR